MRENINTVQRESGEESELFLELSGRDSGLLSERPVEIAQIVESTECRDLNDRFFCFQQKAFCVFDPDAEEGLPDAFAIFFPVGVAEMNMGDAQIRCGFLIIERFHVILFDAGKDVGDHGAAAFSGEGSGAETGHPDQEFGQLEFQHHDGIRVVEERFPSLFLDKGLDFPVGVDEIELIADHVSGSLMGNFEDREEIVVAF